MLPLTCQDAILLEIIAYRNKKEQRNIELCIADIAYYLARLSGSFTGFDGLESSLPSSIVKMTERYEAIKRQRG